jgi:hypothetical protein
LFFKTSFFGTPAFQNHRLFIHQVTLSSIPTPAIVAQAAVRRLPRWALLLFCLAYVLPGFLGREPWKNQDMAAFGIMRALATGEATWWVPRLMGQALEIPALLPYWLGAWAMQLSPSWLPIDFAARIPFGLLLALTLAATWYGVYFLARLPAAQPVAFAFGGEAQPADYARALADGGLLALIAMLGLAQLSHETTPALAQLAFSALLFFAIAASSHHAGIAAGSALVAALGLALSGVPAFGISMALAGAVVRALQCDAHARRWALYFAALGLGAAALAYALGLWYAQAGVLPGSLLAWRNWARLLLWFTWPAWPLALVALWKWRTWWRSLHIALPAGLALVIIVATLIAPNADRTLLLATPMLACLAAFALPTLQRSVTSLIDWFTLLFFSGCGLVIWVVWLAMQTGVPAQPAANVRRLLPGFEPSFGWLAFVAALAATLAWVWLVKWRAGRHRAALWKSLVLPAAGAAMSWLLLMTLWMPLLNFARSYAPLVRQVAQYIGPQSCVHAYGLTPGQIAAFAFHGNVQLRALQGRPTCPWLIVDADAAAKITREVDLSNWQLRNTIRRPSDDNENVLLYERATRSAP